jgi:HSP20 family molecular chaperone IbpA
MTRMTLLSSPLLLGFDEIERTLERVTRNADGYPPYNVERLAPEPGEADRIRISLAVAGFPAEALEVVHEENQLLIRGRQSEEAGEAERSFLHRGIAARQFQRSFLLADGMQVLGADLDRGVLSIDLMRPETRKEPRRIEIARR